MGIRDTSKPRSHYYPVIRQLNRTSIDVAQLLEKCTRTHQTFREELDEMDQKKTEGCSKAEYANLTRDLGINGRSILWGIDSVDFPRSFIHDLMHVGALNTIPNLVKIWTGEFPGLRGVEDGSLARRIGRLWDSAPKTPTGSSRTHSHVPFRTSPKSQA
jgi:hypothetical protein